MPLEDMTPYDRKAWGEVERWRDARLSAQQRHFVPEPVRRRAGEVSTTVRDRVDDVPGADQFIETFRRALDGLLGLVSKAAEASVRRNAVVKAYGKRGHPLDALEQIRALELRDIDKVKPRLSLRYTSASTVEGAAAGLALSGGEILASGGAIFGAGAGGAPGAGLIIGTMAADAAAVLAAMVRVTAHTAAYYGYDTELQEEQLFAAGILSFGLAQQAGKTAAYIELNKLVQGLARKAAWDQLNKNAATKVVRVVYGRLGETLTKNKLGQAVPVLGVALGAGINARLVSRMAADADRLYRERLLREKYCIETSVPEGALDAARSPAIPIAEILEEELEREEDAGPGSEASGEEAASASSA